MYGVRVRRSGTAFGAVLCAVFAKRERIEVGSKCGSGLPTADRIAVNRVAVKKKKATRISENSLFGLAPLAIALASPSS
jgi:predicted oxidoreductase